MMQRKLVAAIACRNQGSRLYGKPLQNLDVLDGIKIIDNVIGCLKKIDCISEIVLGISEGVENEIFKEIAQNKGIQFIVGDEVDVLQRLIQCGDVSNASDIFRVTSESPFLYFEPVEKLWNAHVQNDVDATFLDDIIDGCGFEIIKLDALKRAHKDGEDRHRSEMCSLYIRENKDTFKISSFTPPSNLIRKDLRLTVDNPEDLVVCRTVFGNFKHQAPQIEIDKIVEFLDKRPNLKNLIAPYAEEGYSTMYK